MCKKTECPFCYGGFVFNRTYGSEKKCDYCRGSGEVNEKKLKKDGVI